MRTPINYAGRKDEWERRSRAAYKAWQEACARTGLNIARPWEGLLEDEQAQWLLVYDECWQDKIANSVYKPAVCTCSPSVPSPYVPCSTARIRDGSLHYTNCDLVVRAIEEV